MHVIPDVFIPHKRGFEINSTSPIDDGPAPKGEVAKATLPYCW